MKRWDRSAQFWKGLPVHSTVLFFVAVFCLFGGIGFLEQTISPGQRTVMQSLEGIS